LGLALAAAPAFAQDAAPAAEDTSGDDLVVTATTGDRTALRSSISVSQIDQEAIAAFTPRSEAELLRMIPGINPQDTAGPGGNANIGVRGIPVSTGGSEYVALQEDGLPVTLFGDIQFGNNDYWVRFDSTIERVEAVRGGSASTFASQAPGAVINYISRTGEEEGGEIGISKGLDFRETRFDFRLGGHLNDTLRFHVGGYAREGGGPTNESFNVLSGYQIRANLTQDIAEGRGYVRILFRRLDERAPTFTTMPSLVSISGNRVGNFQPLPTFDAREGSNYSIYNREFQYVTNSGQLATAAVEGIHPTVTSLGAQFHYELSSNIKVDNNFRYTDMSGNFTTQFLNVATTASVLGSVVNGQTVGQIRYANGPRAGQAYTGTYLNNNPNINTIMRDMGSLANNLTLTGEFDAGGGDLTVQAGWFHMRQNISQEWHVNRQFNELSDNNPAQLDLFTAGGTRLTSAGQAGFNDNWGSCCARDVDLVYINDAPFLSVNYQTGGLDLDASIRRDTVRGEGTAQGGIAGPNITTNGVTLPSLVPGGPVEVLNYKDSYTSWSFGALYALTDDLSLFARASRGGRFNADRRTLGGNFNADGSLNQTGAATSINYLNQQELGVKARGDLGSGRYSVEATLFRSTLTENNYDFTRINNPPPNNDPNISNSYRSMGLELSSRLNFGGFRLAADITYTSSKITDSVTAALVDNRPGGIPKLTYLIAPSYDFGMGAIGFSLSGQSSAPLDNFNTFNVAGSKFVSGFITFRPLDNLEVGLNVNNLFNELGYRSGGSLTQLSATSGIFSNSAVTGRTMTASVRYSF
jgi:outer membrane receptor protein involved in Fe transport